MELENFINSALSPNKRYFTVVFGLSNLQTIINFEPESPLDEHFDKLTVISRPYFHLIDFPWPIEREICINTVREINFVQKFNVGGYLFLVHGISNIV